MQVTTGMHGIGAFKAKKQQEPEEEMTGGGGGGSGVRRLFLSMLMWVRGTQTDKGASCEASVGVKWRRPDRGRGAARGGAAAGEERSELL